MARIGDYITILYTEDNDLEYWLEEQKQKGITKHKVIDIDEEGGYIWIENCDYAIWESGDEYRIYK